MSAIDDRVVRMQFDNKQFETGVSETMGSLQKLKEALNLRGSDKGIENVQKAANSLDFGTLNDHIYQVQQNFSFFGEFVRNVFDRISNKVIDLGSTMVKELTTRPLQAGFSEYNLQMDSTQTIMASTGKSIEEVTGYLDELNTYADKTIYSFSDMTANIGKFTNAGVELDDAVAAIQGISNEAAVSGANANEASRAMYNFSQALSAGSVKLIDWKSIENANMATVEFKEQLIDTAVALGTVKKTEDGYVSTTKNLQGKVSDTFTTTKGFNESLSAQWMTTEVLTETLKHYSTDVREMSKAEKDAYEERLKNLGFDDKQIKSIEELGMKAFDSAQDVKTFSQLVDTVKESLGSGWTKSFQLMIGNLEEAKALWTGVNKEINAILDPIAAAREEMLQFWHDNGGRTAAIKAISNVWEGLKSIMGAVSKAYSRVFPPMTGQRLVEITKNIRNLTKGFREFATLNKTVDYTRKIFAGLFNAFKLLITGAQRFLLHFGPVLKLLGNFGSTMFHVAARIGVFITRITNAEDPLIALNDNFWLLANAAKGTIKALENLVKGLLDLVGIHLDGNPISNLFNSIIDFASEHLDFSIFKNLGSIGSVAAGALNGLATALSKILNIGSGGFTSVIDSISKAFKNFSKQTKDASDNTDTMAKRSLPSAHSILDKFVSFAAGAGKKISDFASSIAKKIPKAFEYLGSADFGGLIKNANSLLTGGLLISLQKFVKSYTKMDGSIDTGGIFKAIKDSIGGIGDKAGGVLDSFSEALGRFQENVKTDMLVKIAIAVGVLAGSITVLGTLDAEKTANGIAAIAGCLGMLVASLKTLETGGGVAAAFALSTLGSALIKMALSVAILAGAIKAMSKIDMNELETAFTGIIGLLAALVISVSLLSKFGGDVAETSKGLITLAVAIGVLSLSIKALSNLNMDQLQTGLIGVSVLLGELSVFSNLPSNGALSLQTAVGILATATAIKVLQSVVTTFAGLKQKKLTRGLEGVIELLVGLGLFSALLNNGGLTLEAAASILMTAGAIKVLQGVVAAFASLKPKQLQRGLIGVAGLLLAVAMFSAMLSNSGLSLKAAVSVGILTLAISGLASVVTSFGGMSSEQLGSALNGLAVSMLTMVGALMVLGQGSPMMLVGAASLLVVSVAVWALVPALQELAKISAGDIAKAVGGVVLALVGLSVGLAVLGLVSPLALAASLALAALGAAAGFLAAGLTSLAGGMAAFAGAVGAAATGFVAGVAMIGSGIGALIVSIVAGFGEAIIGFVESIAGGIDRILTAVSTIIHAVGNFIVANTPYILGVIGVLISSVLTLGITFIPQIVALIGAFVVAILSAIVTFIPTITAALISAAITLINALANGIRDNAAPILAAVRNILSSVLELFITAIGELLRMVPGVGDLLADQFENAREAVQKTLAPETLESSTKDAMGGAISGIENGGNEMASAAEAASASTKEGIASNLTGGADISGSFMQELISGFTSANGDLSGIGSENFNAYISEFTNAGEANSAGTTLNSAVLEGLGANSDAFASAGTEDITAFLGSFNPDLAGKAGTAVSTAAANGAGSNSQKFAQAGRTDAQKFINSLSNGNANSAGKKMANTGASGASATKSAYQSTGTNVASGFNWGVASPAAMAAANAAGRRLGAEALRGIKTATAVKSPSREAMKIGRFVGEGLSIGINAMADLVYNESASLGKSSLNGIKDSLSKMSKYVDMDMDVDPTIRPVLDLTDVQNGINQMNGMFNRADDSFLVGFGNGAYANNVLGSLLNSNGIGLNAGGLPGAFNEPNRSVEINVNLQYDASADANELARGFARAVQPYIVRSPYMGRGD